LYLLVDLQEAAKSNLAAALSTTVEELADHEARASTGDQPQSAVTDVERARQLVVSSQVHTLSTSLTDAQRARQLVVGSQVHTLSTSLTDAQRARQLVVGSQVHTLSTSLTDVQRARQLVVSSQVHTLSTSPSKRRKRTASGNLGTLTGTIGREYATFGFKSR